MKLYFIRHGKAGFHAATDEARPLTTVGVEQAKNNGAILKVMGVMPAKIYCSPRLRAQQTAQHIGQALNIEAEINEACDFSFTATKAFQLASNFDEDDEILFVGHNPSMSEVVSSIKGAPVDFSPCAMACATRVNLPHPAATVLEWLLTPKVVSTMLKNQDY